MRVQDHAQDSQPSVAEPPVVRPSFSAPLAAHAGGLAGNDRGPLQAPPGSQRQPAWLGYSDVVAAVWLSGSLLCLGLALCMTVGEQRRVYLWGWSQPIPETCMAYSRFGIDCPGCGLTRTFVYLAHGQVASAWQLNAVGMALFAFVCLQIPFGIAQLLFRSRHRWVETWGHWNDWATAALLMALVLQWLVRLSERIWT